MKIKFETPVRFFLATLAAMLLWSIWAASAQNETNNNAAGAVVFMENSANATNHAQAAVSPALETPQWVNRLAADFPFLKDTFWGNELWKYLFSLIYIFLAFYVSKLVDFLTRVWLKKWAEKTKTTFDDLLLDVLHGPVKVVVFIIFLRIGLEVFRWPDVVEKILTKGFTVIVAVAVTYMVMKLVDLMMGYWHQRAQADADKAFNQQLLPIIRKSLKAFVVAVAALVTLQNLGINITAAIASLSIGGLAVGLAAQDTLANLFGAVAIFLDKPFRIGDYITVDNLGGHVESIGLRSTRVRNLDGHLIAIPNKTMGNAVIVNVTQRPAIRTEMNIGLTYNTSGENMKRALAIIQEIFGSHPRTKDLTFGFNKFTDSALNIWVVHVWDGIDFKAYLADLQEMNLSLKGRFDAEGINFAFPTQTLHVKQDSGWRLETGPTKTPSA